jgi:hypothetical protein
MIQLLDHAAVGRPLTRCGVSLFPVYMHQRDPGVTSGDIAAVQITEQTSAKVPTLQATNLTGAPVLLVEGEAVTGGRQDRVLNVSVLLGAGVTIDIPVSCVEQGRWGGGTRFGRGEMMATRRVRREKTAGVTRNVRANGSRRSDQGDVWSAVHHELNRLGLHNATGTLDDMSRGITDDIGRAVDELIALGPLPGQCGVVVAHGSRVVAADVFASSGMLRDRWAAIVRSHMVDAPGAVRGTPSATRALKFLHRFARGTATSVPGVGLGREHHITTCGLVGQALLWDDVIIHASAFALAA